METSLILNKLERLPEFLQLEVVDFVDFLLKKYQIEQESIKNENLSEAEKQTLLQRHQKMRDEPENSLTIEEFKQQILAKYNQK